MKLHRCRWVDDGSRFTPPTPRPIEVEHASERMVLELMYGFTVVRQRCTVCGLVRHERHQGAPVERAS